MPLAPPDLVVQITDSHWRRRKDALETLEHLHSESSWVAFHRMQKSLSDGNLQVRRACTHAIGELSLPEVWGRTPGDFAAQAVPELARCLADVDPTIRKASKGTFQELEASGVVGSMAAAAQSAIPDLIAGLSDDAWARRQAATKALGDLGPGGVFAAQAMAPLLADDAGNCRETAKATLDNLIGLGFVAADLRNTIPSAACRMIPKLAHKDWRVRAACALALGTGGVSVALGAQQLVYIVAKESRDLTTRILACELLKTLGLAGLPAVPELAVVAKGAGEGKDPALRRAAFSTLLSLRQELVAAIGRGISAKREVQAGVSRAQLIAERLGRSVAFDRLRSVEELMQPSWTHVAGIAELLRVLLDPECPGAAAGQESYKAAIQGLFKFRDAKLSGNFDTGKSGPDLVRALSLGVKDKNWSVRIACAEALMSLAIALQEPMACLQNALQSSSGEQKAAAQRILRKMDIDKELLDPHSLAEKAATELRAVKSVFTSFGFEGKLSPNPSIPRESLEVARSVAQQCLLQLLEHQLIEELPGDRKEAPRPPKPEPPEELKVALEELKGRPPRRKKPKKQAEVSEPS